MLNFDELLPIGSVVILKNAYKKLMIYGVGQTDMSSDTNYDYIGVMYPEGNMGEGSQFLFNHSDIDQVFFTGYEDEERDEFVQKLQQIYEENSL
ncbi:MAG: DUF4176 domain-containing protein [Eubacterium sp.]|nr:DUF4176 domain-containing protein [Eubacterium sp.]